jgi:hypothetical protein
MSCALSHVVKQVSEVVEIAWIGGCVAGMQVWMTDGVNVYDID